MKTTSTFDRTALNFYPLSERTNKVDIVKDSVYLDAIIPNVDNATSLAITRLAEAILSAKQKGKSVLLTFGAHTIKNGLGLILADLSERGFITHLATNGAGIIHDWEFAWQGLSSEDVRENAAAGKFGMWKETGEYINTAILVGSYKGLGYGESVGTFIDNDGAKIPNREELEKVICDSAEPSWKRSAASDIISAMDTARLQNGIIHTKHKFKNFSLQYRALRAGIPFTAHPMFGHDIIYTHPMNTGAAIGRTAERDFLRFVSSVSNLAQGGVYISVGSAIMSPMVFEKSFSMANNVSISNGQRISGHHIFVIDIQKGTWDWSKGEPPMDDPAYYLRFMKTFNRMGGDVEYIELDNRAFLLNLRNQLIKRG